MKTIGVRALRENPGVLSQSAEAGEYVLVTNRSDPVSLAIPFDEDLLQLGVHVNVAIKLYQDGVLTLPRAARIARLSVEEFLGKLAILGVVVVEQDADELEADLAALND